MRARVNIERLLQGDRLAIARAITAVENEEEGAIDFLGAIFAKTGRAYRVGITGPPGAGKSTITNKLSQWYRRQGKKVGVIAVDPTSPFTGGALLGDRVRMTDVDLDEGVFIRSMASRGSLGGLSKKAAEAADVLDAAGEDIILMETVGVGQSELDIAGAADTTIVVLVPESGDSIQAMKAGLMEIADFFVLNKADRAGADQAAMSLQMILNFRRMDGWRPGVLKSIASEGSGIAEIAVEIGAHREFLEGSGSLAEKRSTRVRRWIRDLIADRLRVDFWTSEREALLDSKVGEVMALHTNPYEAAGALVSDFTRRA